MKKVTICITGSIAAHKIPLIIDELARYPLTIYVAMTKKSAAFVSPLTLEIISKNKIVTEGMTAQAHATVDHVFLAQETDLIVIMPATADIIGKVSNGIADDIVSSICMAIPADKPKLICPAMNTEMYNQSILQENLAKLTQRNYKEIPPRVDILTSGKRGIGALAESHIIVNQILSELNMPQTEKVRASFSND